MKLPLRLLLPFIIAFVLLAYLGLQPGTAAAATNPVINIWYGAHQVFGQLGTPQRWINILGNVSDPDGIGSLVYSLNGGPASPLSIGPNTTRLVASGDFNIEIPITHPMLNSGLNQVVITATDSLNNTSQKSVTLTYHEGNSWPLPYTIDWSSVATISEVAQVVDGLWALEGDSVRPMVRGYDRLIAIGDMAWDDYQVIVPFTIHSTSSSNTGGVGVITRWQGHFPIGDEQPATGWWQIGAYGYYRYRADGNHLALRLSNEEPVKNYDVDLDFGTRYILKMQVETTAQPGGQYRLKVWEDGQPEPIEWQLAAHDSSSDLANGSMLLVAHEADASFGDVSVAPLADVRGSLELRTSGGTINVNPNQTQYLYGQVVTLTAIADSGWSFDSWSGSLTGSTSPVTLTISGDHVITATFTQHSYNLTVEEEGNGTVSVQPVEPTYAYGQVITLTAVPEPGWSLDSWSGALIGSANPATLTMTADRVVTATFILNQHLLEVSRTGSGSGQVTSSPAGIICGGDCSETYDYGTVVTLTAVADTGSTFAGWGGACSGMGSCVVTMDGAKSVTATFTHTQRVVFLPVIVKNE
jgi:hypothetical protein